MTPGQVPRSNRVLALAIVIALITAVTNGILGVRLDRERGRNDRLSARVAAAEADLANLRKRLTSDLTGGVLDRILQSVSRLRGLPIKRTVKAQVLTDADLRRRVSTAFQKENPRAEVDAAGKVLTTLGLMSEEQSLYDVLLGVQAEQVAGFYDVRTKEMVVGGDAKNPSPLERTFLAHEYAHALTDQHFGIEGLEALSREQKDDEALAYLSLIEGDATLLMGEYVREVLSPSEQQEFSREAEGITTPKLDAAPRVIRASLQFPYDEGVQFVRAVFDRGGNAAIDRAYRDPPASTEQILHPERYYGRRDAPTAVSIPDVAAALGSGWHDIDEGGIGEFDVRLILDEFLSTSDANAAASGWDGGAYRAIDGPAGVVFAGMTVWDSAAEAREAADAFDDWMPRRYRRSGSQRRIPGFSGFAWESPAGAGEILRAGQRVLVILGPTLDLVERSRRAFGSFGSISA